MEYINNDEAVRKLQAERDQLEYILLGVMHFIDKWLDNDELKQNEVNRAATMREKVLKLLEGHTEGVSFNREANETKAMYMSDKDALNDRKLFVANLGVLLSQTREGVISASLDDEEIVTVHYKNGHFIRVNVNMDSYAAIIRDVCKCIG